MRKIMDAATLADCTEAQMSDAIRFAEPITLAMEAFEINNQRRQSAFLATISIETSRLKKLEEGLYYKDPARLAMIYPRVFKNASEASPYARNPDALSQLLYGGYHGRGCMMLTWEKNYKAASDALAFDYLDHPELLLEIEHATLTAAWFWKTNGCNEAADRGDMKAVTRIVNGPALMHLSERTELYNKALDIL